MSTQRIAGKDPVSSPLSVGAAMLWGIGVGAVTSALALRLDLLTSGSRLAPAEAARLVLAAMALGMLPTMLIFAALAVLVRSLQLRVASAVLVACLTGIAVQAALAFGLSGRQLLATAPVPWLVAGFAYWLTTRSGRHVWAVGLAPALLMASSAALGAGVLAPRSLLLLPAAIVVTAVALFAARAAKSRPLITLTPLVLLVTLTQLGTRSPAWRTTPPADSTADSLQDLAGAATPVKRPNVILIVLDTTRADYMGCYGNQDGLTPFLDSFAAEGVLYEQAIATASWTVPSHASLFTGLYPVTHGCDTIPHRWLDNSFETIAEVLAGVGYQTVGLVANGYLIPSNLLQGINEYLTIDMDSAHRGTQGYKWMAKAGGPQRWSDQGAAEGVSALDEWLQTDRVAGSPFYLFVNLMEAHWPMHPPYAWRHRCLPEGVGYLQATRAASGFYGPKWMAGQRRTPLDEKIIRGLYAADIAYQDAQFGALIDRLRQTGELDDTIVIVTADHGENLGEGGRWDHVFAINDKLIHVPLIIRYPRNFPASTRIAGQCQLIDIVPTVRALIPGLDPMPELPGRPLLPDQFTGREWTYAEVYPYYGHLERMESVTGFARDTAAFLAHYRAIRTPQYKFVWSSFGDHKLYDLVHDPSEELDLASDKPEIALELSKKLDEWYANQQRYVPRPGPDGQPIAPAILKSLKSLGYVGEE